MSLQKGFGSSSNRVGQEGEETAKLKREKTCCVCCKDWN